MATSRKNNQFVISFGDLQLPEPLADRLAYELGRTALQFLSGIDLHQGDHFNVRSPLEYKGKWIDLQVANLDKVALNAAAINATRSGGS